VKARFASLESFICLVSLPHHFMNNMHGDVGILINFLNNSFELNDFLFIDDDTVRLYSGQCNRRGRPRQLAPVTF